MGDDVTGHPNFRRRLDRQVPLRRLGRQDEMGALVATLRSRKAMPVTGQFITVAAGCYPSRRR